MEAKRVLLAGSVWVCMVLCVRPMHHPAFHLDSHADTRSYRNRFVVGPGPCPCVSPSLVCFSPYFGPWGLEMPAKSCRIIQGSRVLSLGRAASLLPCFTATSTRDIQQASSYPGCRVLPCQHCTRASPVSLTHHGPLRPPDDWPLDDCALRLDFDFVIGSNGHFDGDFSERACVCVARNKTARLHSEGMSASQKQSRRGEARTLVSAAGSQSA